MNKPLTVISRLPLGQFASILFDYILLQGHFCVWILGRFHLQHVGGDRDEVR